jgi:predicted amidophosphoribosyltransferase
MAAWFRATHASPLQHRFESVGAGHAPPASARRRLDLPFLDLLLPERCAVCGRGETVFCGLCAARLTFLHGSLCARCGAPTAWPVERCAECAGRRLAFTTARAAVAYEGVARKLVVGWKERGLRALTAVFADLVAETVAKPPADCVAFVPGDRDRTLWRGQNPAEALATGLAARWELPLVPLLERVRTTPRQRRLPRAARRGNVQNAFSALDAPAAVALVDDVYTTGATVSAAATSLRWAGARAVGVVTFARATRR